MGFLLKYDLEQKLKNLTLDLNEMEVKIGNFTDEFIIPPLEKAIDRMKTVVDFNMTELKLKIKDSICDFNKKFVETFSNEELLLDKIKKELKNKTLTEIYESKKDSLKETFDEFKKKADEKLNSSIINDILDKISQINGNISEKLNNSEIKDNVADLITKVKKLGEENSNSSIIQKIDELKDRIHDSVLEKIMTNLDESMTNFNNKLINDLLEIKNTSDKIKELREKFKDKNATVNEMIDKLKEKMDKKLEELKGKTEEFVDNHPVLKPLYDKLNEKNEELKNKAKDKLAEYKKEFEDLQDLVEKLNETNSENLEKIKNSIKQRLNKINGKELVKQLTKASEFQKELGEEMKNFTLIESSLERLRNVFDSNKIGENMDNQKEKVKQSLENIQNKIKDFMEDDTTLKITKGKLKNLNDKLDKAGVINAVNELLSNASNLDNNIKDSILDRIDVINKIIYNIEEKVKEINGTNIKLELDNLRNKGKDLRNISLYIQKLKDFLNTTEEVKKDKLKKLLNDIKDKVKSNQLVKPILDRINEFEKNLNNSGLPDSIKSHIDKIKGIKKALEDLDLKNKAKLKETLNDLHEKLDDKIEGINGTELLDKIEKPLKDLPNLNLTLQNINDTLNDLKLKNKDKLDKLEKLLEELKTNSFVIQPVVEKLNDLKKKIEDAGVPTAIQDYKDALNGVKDALDKLSLDKLSLGELSLNTPLNLSDLNKTLYDLHQKFDDKVREINGTAFLEKVKAIEEPLKSNLTEVLNKVKEYLEGTNENNDELKELLENLKNSIKSLVEQNPTLQPLLKNLTKVNSIFNETGVKKYTIEHINDLSKLLDIVSNVSLTSREELLEKLKELIFNVSKEVNGTEYAEEMIKLAEEAKNLQKLKPFLVKLKDVMEDPNIEKFAEGEKMKLTELNNLYKKILDATLKFMNDNNDLKPALKELERLQENFLKNIGKDKEEIKQDVKNYMEGLIELDYSIANLTAYNIKKLKEFAYDTKDLLESLIKKINGTKLLETIHELEENSTKPLMELKDFLESNATNKDKVLALIDKLNNTKLQPIIVQLENIETKIKDSGIKDAAKDYLLSIKGIKDALESLNFDLPDGKYYDIREKIKAFNGKDFLDKVHAFEKNFNLSDLNATVNNLKDFLDEKRKEEILPKLEELKAKLENHPLLKPVLEKLKEIENDIKLSIDDSGVTKAVKDYIDSIKDLEDLIKKLIGDDFSKLNETLYNLPKQLLEKLQNYQVKPLKLNGLSNKMNELKASFNECFLQLVYLINSSNMTEFKDKEKELLANLTLKLDDLKKENKVLDVLLKDIDLEKLNNNELKLSFKDYLISIGDLLKTFKNIPLNDLQKLNDTLYKLKDKVDSFDITPYILKLNSTLFDEKNNILEKVKNQTEKIELLKEKLKEKLKDNIETTNATLIAKLNETGKLEKFQEYAYKLHDLVYKVKHPNEVLLELKDKLMIVNVTQMIQDLNSSFYNCDTVFLEKVLLLDKIKPVFEKIKNLKDIKDSSKLKIIMDDLKEHAKKLVGDKRFVLIQDKIKELNDTILDAMDKLGFKDDLEKLKEKINKRKELMDVLKKNYEKLSLKQNIYKLKEINASALLDKAETALNKYKDEVQDLREIEYNAAKIQHILDKVDIPGLTEKQKQKVKELIENSKEKAHSLDYTLLEKLIDKINKANDNLAEKINVDEVHEKVKEFLQKCEELEKKLEKFPNSTQSESYKKQVEYIKNFKLKDLLDLLDKMDAFLEEEYQKYNGTAAILIPLYQLIEKKYKTLPKDSSPAELNERIMQLIKEEAEKYKENTEKMVEGTKLEDILKKRKELQDKIGNETDLDNLVDFLKNKSENVENKLKDLADKYRGKTLKDLLDLIKTLRSNTTTPFRDALYKAFSEANPTSDLFELKTLENLRDQINKLKNLPNKSDIVDKINDIISKIKKLRESLQKNDVDSAKPTIKTLDLIGLLNELKKIREEEKLDIAEEVNKIKKVVELVNEISDILDDSSTKKILERLINSGLISLRTLEEKKKSKPKKSLKKLRRADSEAEVTCKIDDSFLSEDKLSANDENITTKVLNNEVYDVLVQEELQLDLKDSETKCNSHKIDDSKNNVEFKSETPAVYVTEKKRVEYNLSAKINNSYNIPDFYYLYMKTKVKYRKTGANADTEEEVDSYCILEDGTDKENAKFKCYAFPEDIESVSETNVVSSEYIKLPRNTTEYNNGGGVNFYRKRSGRKLSAGAIVGIILGCLAVLIAIIIACLCIKRTSQAAVAAPFENITESHNKMQVSSFSGQYPVKVTNISGQYPVTGSNISGQYPATASNISAQYPDKV